MRKITIYALAALSSIFSSLAFKTSARQMENKYDSTLSYSIKIAGAISRDTTWQGDILIEDHVVVQSGVTLRIDPGTKVKFKHYRGYREPEKRLSISVHGAIIAEGTAQQPIYFTSDAQVPQNGDWSMIRLFSSVSQSRFRYCVFEFGQHGLNVWNEDPIISHSVFRWNNWEGVYFESYCTAAIESCRIVENGYNGLAAEQFNTITMDFCDVWRNGTNGVHVDATELEIRQSRVHDNQANGLSVDNNATLRALGVAIYGNMGWAIGSGEGVNTVTVSNLIISNNRDGTIAGPYTSIISSYTPPNQVNIGFDADTSYALGYVPGDPQRDAYMYVYPDDETRRIVRKIGNGLGLTWSLAWDGKHIWTATVSGTIYKLDPVTGDVIKQFRAPGPQPWGMTFDGNYLWLVDFAEKRISKIDTASGEELSTFPTPSDVNGCKGVAWDGAYLNVMGWSSPTIYRMDRQGTLVARIQLDRGGGGGIAWDGSHFWVPAGNIIKYDNQGHAIGWIYAASEGTWDLTWDGQYLWASQRTNENWPDAKIFQLQILDDHTQNPTIFVRPDGNDLNNGSTSAAAKQHIQAGIDAVAEGGRVFVAQGMYQENLLINNKNTVIEGGYESANWTRDSVLLKTTIDGRGKGTVITLMNCDVKFDGFIITGGITDGQGGGGIDASNSTLRVHNCLIIKNTAVGQNEWGGAIAIGGGNLSLSNSRILDNFASGGAGGLRIGYSTFEVTRTVISGNTGRPGIHINDASGVIANCTVVDNSQGGMFCNAQSGMNVSVVNSIFWNNNVYDLSGSTCSVSYSDMQTGHAGIGNISLNPLFQDAGSGDYYLQRGSPCIDAGDPSSPLDPDSTRSDMGAFYFEQIHTYAARDGTNLLTNIRGLSQNYPNPFNPSTIISFTLSSRSFASLKVFDILGREVATIISEELLAGNYSRQWNAMGMPSGVYFYRLEAGSFSETKKLVLLR